MANLLYFAVFQEKNTPKPFFQMGFGFDEDGSFLPPALMPEAEGIGLQDRRPPSPAGLADAADFLRGYPGLVLCDFEGPFREELAGLIRTVPAGRLVVPPEYRAVPHKAVLAGPYVPDQPFLPWLQARKERWGPVFLDCRPLSWVLALDGSGFLPDKAEPGPEPSFYSPELFCRYRTERTGGIPVFHFFDTARTLEDRVRAADCPCVILAQEAERLAREEELKAPDPPPSTDPPCQ